MGAGDGRDHRLAVSVAFVAVAVVLYLLAGQADAQSLSAITAAIESADSEIRTSMFPAISTVLGALVLIGLAIWLVRVIQRGGG